MILFLHNRYRTTGGEERVVEDLQWLVRDHLHQECALLARDSAHASRTRAAISLLRGGEHADEVAATVRRTGAKIVHAHNLHPLLGWRALAAARAAGAKVVLQLHQYRLVCAVGVCFTDGKECVRCHGLNTLPGVIHNCRGSRAEAAAYAAGIALAQRKLVAHADAIVVPSAFAEQRLRHLGAPLPSHGVHVIPPPVRLPWEVPGQAGASRSDAPQASGATAAKGSGSDAGYALVVSRLAVEKGVEVAIDACVAASKPLLIAGDGPQMQALQDHARRIAGQGAVAVGVPQVAAPPSHPRADMPPPAAPTLPQQELIRFTGAVSDQQLQALRQGAALALVPSLSAETFGLAAAEAMAAGLPVAGSRIGALPELIEQRGLVPPGDASALAQAIERLWGDAVAGQSGRELIAKQCSPDAVAQALSRVYDGLSSPTLHRR